MDKNWQQATMPVRTNTEIRTVFITCDELKQLPDWTIRRHLGPYTVVRTPGAQFNFLERSELESLKNLLVQNRGIEHLVVCQHSLCSKICRGINSEKIYEISSKRFRRRMPTSTAAGKSIDLNTYYRRLLWQQQSLRKTLQSFKQWLSSFRRDDIEVHAWIYESETDWISALDADSEYFVPLTAHTHFYKDNLMMI